MSCLHIPAGTAAAMGLPLVLMNAPPRQDVDPRQKSGRRLLAARSRGKLTAADERAPEPRGLVKAKRAPDVPVSLEYNEAIVLKALIAASGCCVTISSIEAATGCVLGNASQRLVLKLNRAWPRRVQIVHLTGAGWAICGHGDVLERLLIMAMIRLGEIETGREWAASCEPEKPVPDVIRDGNRFPAQSTTKDLAGEKDAPLPIPRIVSGAGSLPDSGARGRSGAGGAA